MKLKKCICLIIGKGIISILLLFLFLSCQIEINEQIKAIPQVERNHTPNTPNGYYPQYWNDGMVIGPIGTVVSRTRQDNNNCYNYACNRDATVYGGYSAWAQPGKSQGLDIGKYDNNKDYGAWVAHGAIIDGLELKSYNFETCLYSPPGKILVALYINIYNNAFHWARQDVTGGWSHKYGRDEVKRFSLSKTWREYRFYAYFYADVINIQGMGGEVIKGRKYPRTW